MQLSLRLSPQNSHSHNTRWMYACGGVHENASAAFITHTRAAAQNNDRGEIIAGIKILLRRDTKQWEPRAQHVTIMLSKPVKGT